jgi:5-methylthioribose kinase
MSAEGRQPSDPFELTRQNAAAYLRLRPEYAAANQSTTDNAVCPPSGKKTSARSEHLNCRELGGGVSNTVILVEAPGERFVIKQALPQLRVKDEWLVDRGRIFRERDALADCAKLLPRGWVPEVLWSDEPNYVFAMRAAEEPSEFWKNRLLEGRIEAEWARRAGVALGLTIRASWRSEFFERKYGDQTAFGQLRTDPYYRTIARRNPDIAVYVEEWLAVTESRRLALTHGDWSPKNMLVTPSGMVFIDYECAHFGDPCFDSAFAINHFLLKGFRRPDLAEGYLGLARVFFTWTLGVLPSEALREFEAATARHLGFLLLARVDGKSPVEYLTDEEVRDRLRQAAKTLIVERAERLERCFEVALAAARAGLA